MIVEIIPEEIIWEFLSQKLGKKPVEPLRHQKHFSRLPARVDLSADFVERWKKNVKIAVQREIVEAFRNRSFLILENDQVRRVTVADPEFWQSYSLSFSEDSVQALWQLIISRAKGEEPILDGLVPSDALILSIIDNTFYDRFSLAWLAKKKAPWIVSALFIQHQVHVNPPALPWEAFFQTPQSVPAPIGTPSEGVPLPLREFLVEKTAEIFRILARAINAYSGVEGSSGRVDSPHVPQTTPEERPSTDTATNSGIASPAPNLQTTGEWAGPNFQGEKHFRFRFDDAAEILRLHNNGSFGEEIVRKALQHWTGAGTLGLDDDRYINGAIQQFGLFASLESFAGEVKTIFEVASQAAITSARSVS